MAYRDSRKNRSRLLLFISSVVLGIASMVAIASFGENLRKNIDSQAAELIGADLVIDSRKAISDSGARLIDSIARLSDETAREENFVSMALFQKNGGNRLVQVRALEGNFPFYGSLKTRPEAAARTFGDEKQVLVDKTLMLQFDAAVGDTVLLGTEKFTISGTLEGAPGQTGISSAVAPAIFVPLRYLSNSGLNQKGSRIQYHYYFRLPENFPADELVETLEKRLENDALDAETIRMRKENTGRAFSDMTEFLSLVGFVALLLGCIGVASAIQIYIREKINSIAILRCLGVKSSEAFLIYLIQIIGIGFAGALAGAVLGVLVQQFIPVLLQDLIPVDVSNDISWFAILQGLLIGVVISVLFALIPLISIRQVSPISTLRASDQPSEKKPFKALLAVYTLILLFIGIFARMQMPDWTQTIIFLVAVVAGFLVLYGTSILLIKGVKKYFPHRWSYVWRQGLANLFRPNNQTAILVMAIGLGTTFIATLFFVRGLLIDQIRFSAGANQPNMVLFDIQTPQKDRLVQLTESSGFPVLQEVPIVTVQVERIKGYTARQVRQDSTLGISNRAFSREIRVTFRDSLIDSEKLRAGEWIGRIAPNDSALVSLEEGYAERLGVDIGDEIVFNVQGLLIPARVGSLREVDWNRVQTNFRIVFPRGVIDNAPQFHVLMTRVDNEQESARFQLEVVKSFPNVSVIDLKLILKVLDDILSKVSFVIQFMAGLSICTGLIVLVSSVMISKFQRIRESVLLKTLGAARKQILVITALEYAFLGLLSAVSGLIIALLASWGLAIFSFEIPFYPDPLLILLLLVAVPLLTVTVGVLNLAPILRRPPLEILRKED
jgi:putative ABC transport system permease protein